MQLSRNKQEHAELFVITWQTSKTTRAVARRLGLSRRQACSLARYYVRCGVKLKAMVSRKVRRALARPSLN